MQQVREDRVVFLDGLEPRVLKGHIVEEGERFLTLRRRNGVVKIALDKVLKIEYNGGPGDCDGDRELI